MSRKSKAVQRRRGSIIEVDGARGTKFKIKFDLPARDGKRRVFYKTVSTYAEAEAELTRLAGQAGRGVDLDGGKQLLSTWIEDWLTYHVGEVSTRTSERYAELLRGHVAKEIGHHRLDCLGPAHIEKFYRGLAAKRAPRTVNHTHRVLAACLKDALRLRVIVDNPAANVKRPRIKRQANADMHVLALARMVKLFDVVRLANLKSVPYALAVLAFDSGARRGELTAVRWSDLDVEKRTLRIERAVDETKAHGVRIKDSPKNESSRRTIQLSVQTVATLKTWRAKLAEDSLKIGRPLPADALIFPLSVETPHEPLRPREVTKAFGRLVKNNGFAPFRLHDFRHSCASHMLANGKPVPEVSRHLGHSSPQVTMMVYAHAIPKAETGLGLLDELMPVAGAAE